MQSAECQVQSAECRVPSAECRVQSAECRVHPQAAAPPPHTRQGGLDPKGHASLTPKRRPFWSLRTPCLHARLRTLTPTRLTKYGAGHSLYVSAIETPNPNPYPGPTPSPSHNPKPIPNPDPQPKQAGPSVCTCWARHRDDLGGHVLQVDRQPGALAQAGDLLGLQLWLGFKVRVRVRVRTRVRSG